MHRLYLVIAKLGKDGLSYEVADVGMYKNTGASFVKKGTRIDKEHFMKPFYHHTSKGELTDGMYRETYCFPEQIDKAKEMLIVAILERWAEMQAQYEVINVHVSGLINRF